MTKIFIDGKEGTTGLRIFDRLSLRSDLALLTLPERERKNPELRRQQLNACDVAILCLPEDAAIEACEMIESPDVRIIDPSTAHRIADGWVYGLPEVLDKIKPLTDDPETTDPVQLSARRYLADQGISIDAMLQREPEEGEGETDIIILTHVCKESAADAAIAKIEALSAQKGKVKRIRLEELQ